MRLTLVLLAAIMAPAAHAQPIRTSVQKIYNDRHTPAAEPATRVAIRPSTPVAADRAYEVIVPGSCAGRATWNSRYDSTRRPLQVALAAYPVIGTPTEGASPRDDASLAAVYTTCDWQHERVSIRTPGDFTRRVDTTASYMMNGIIVDPGTFEGVGRPPVAVQRAYVAAVERKTPAIAALSLIVSSRSPCADLSHWNSAITSSHTLAPPMCALNLGRGTRK